MLDVTTTSTSGDHLAEVVKERNMSEVTRLKVVRDSKSESNLEFLVRIYCEPYEEHSGYVRVISHYYGYRNTYLYKGTPHKPEWRVWDHWAQLYMYEDINKLIG